MDKILAFLRLDSLKGGRTQIVIVAYGIVNLLASVGILKLSPSDLQHINEFLTWAGAYFFAEKVTTAVTK